MENELIYNDIRQRYLISKDRMGECLDNLQYNLESHTFCGVIGSFSFLNYLSRFDYDNIILFDINSYQIKNAQYVLELIRRSKNRKEFLENYFMRKINKRVDSLKESFLKKKLNKDIVKRVSLYPYYTKDWIGFIKSPKNIKNTINHKKYYLKGGIYIPPSNQAFMYLGYGWLENEAYFQKTKQNINNISSIRKLNVFEQPSFFKTLPEGSVLFMSNIKECFPQKWETFETALSKFNKAFTLVFSLSGVRIFNSEKTLKKTQKVHYGIEIIPWTLVKLRRKVFDLIHMIQQYPSDPHKNLFNIIKPELNKRNVLEISHIIGNQFGEIRKTHNYKNIHYLSHDLENHIEKNDIILTHALLTQGEVSEKVFKNIFSFCKKHKKKLVMYEKNSESKDFKNKTLKSRKDIEKLLKKEKYKRKFAKGRHSHNRNIIYVFNHEK